MIEAHIRISWRTLGLAAGAVAGVLVLVLLLQEVGTLVKRMGHGKVSGAKIGAVQSVNKSNFAYLVPAPDASWTFDPATVVIDGEKGMVKYGVHLEYADASVTLSQQSFPEDLAPRGSDKFNAFINTQRVVQSQSAGAGTVYYMSALKNGAPANGVTDTIIYATDTVLMFGRSDRMLGYDGWAKLVAAMGPGK